MLFQVAHHIFMAAGVGINLMTLIIIVSKTPTSIKDYSIILFNTAFNDLLAMIMHVLLNARLFVDDTVIVHMSDGFCRVISDLCCGILFEFIHDTIMQTCALIAISFWYRRRILYNKGSVGWCKLQTLMIVAFSIHLPHSIGFFNAIAPREELEPFIAEIYGADHVTSYALFGFMGVRATVTQYTMGHLMSFPGIMYTYIFFTRRSLISILSTNADKMSLRTRETHQSLLKVLSIHAVLPGCAIFSFVILFLQMTNVYHSIEVETLEYTIAVLPSIINPVLTLYFISPYKEFVTRIVIRKASNSIITVQDNSKNSITATQFRFENS